MRFKYPGFDVAFCTGLWIVIGGFGIWSGFTTGQFPWYLIACAVIAVPALGMWFQIRSAGYVFGAFNGILSVVGLLAMILGAGFSPKSLIRVGAMVYAAVVAFQWARSFEE